ncbi:hypothetical protein INR49_024570 [Caranx melampygus]|nr:hypothetical protein INR49_024570 [Caranx melampygus]
MSFSSKRTGQQTEEDRRKERQLMLQTVQKSALKLEAMIQRFKRKTICRLWKQTGDAEIVPPSTRLGPAIQHSQSLQKDMNDFGSQRRSAQLTEERENHQGRTKHHTEEVINLQQTLTCIGLATVYRPGPSDTAAAGDLLTALCFDYKWSFKWSSSKATEEPLPAHVSSQQP